MNGRYRTVDEPTPESTGHLPCKAWRIPGHSHWRTTISGHAETPGTAHRPQRCYLPKAWKNGSGREARAALAATGVDDLAPRFGRHAGTETMGTCALQITRLESTFHGRNPDELCLGPPDREQPERRDTTGKRRDCQTRRRRMLAQSRNVPFVQF